MGAPERGVGSDGEKFANAIAVVVALAYDVFGTRIAETLGCIEAAEAFTTKPCK